MADVRRINYPRAVRPAEWQSSRHAPSCRCFGLGDAAPQATPVGARDTIRLRRPSGRGNGTTERACYLDELTTQNADGTSIDNLTYTYDALGRVSTFASTDGTATYGYDHTSQLVSATYTTATGGHQPNNVSFTWDANGNNYRRRKKWLESVCMSTFGTGFALLYSSSAVFSQIGSRERLFDNSVNTNRHSPTLRRMAWPSSPLCRTPHIYRCEGATSVARPRVATLWGQTGCDGKSNVAIFVFVNGAPSGVNGNDCTWRRLCQAS